jgi:hypothetical protein
VAFYAYAGDTRYYDGLFLIATNGGVADFGVNSPPADGRWTVNAGPATITPINSAQVGPAPVPVPQLKGRWTPATVYAAGDITVNPSGDLVTAIAAHTSGANYTPANWATSGTFTSINTAASVAANTARIVGKLRRNVQSVSVLNVSDSTGVNTPRWPYQTCLQLAALFPAYTILFKQWNDSTLAYDTTVTISTGTGTGNAGGPFVLTWFNAAVSGTATQYLTGSKWAASIVATNPDLVFVNHGLNQGDPTSPDAQRGPLAILVGYMSLTEELASTFPLAGIVLVAENPTTVTGRTTWQGIIAGVQADLCALRGYGLIDVHQAFLDYAKANSVTVDSLLADQIHPTDIISLSLITPLFVAAFKGTSGTVARAQSEPPLQVKATNYLGVNFDFNNFAPPAAPVGWQVSATATASLDTTNFETQGGAVKLTNNGAGQSELDYIFGSNGAPAFSTVKGYMAGQLVIGAIRVYVPAANTSTSSLVIQDQRGTSVYCRSDFGGGSAGGRFRWVFAVYRLVDPTTFFAFQIIPRLTGSATDSITVDRAYLLAGTMPNCG